MSSVTVVIPYCDEHAHLLPRAIASVEAQTVRPDDIIPVHDRGHRGAAWARNLGASQVETKWLAWLDADDELLPDHLEVLLKGAEESGADLIYSYAEFPDSRDPLATVHNGVLVPEPIGVPFGSEQANWLRYQGNFIPITYLLRAAWHERVGGMPASGGPGAEEDYLFLLRLLNAGAKFHHVAKRTWIYHVWGGNTGGGWEGTGASNRAAFSK
jgi:glycosyltransferase involved in cell wall biosynthesis